MSDSSEDYSERLGVWEHKYSKVLSSVNEGGIDLKKITKIKDKAYSIQADILSTIDELTAYTNKIEAYLNRLDAAIDDTERRQG
jgi:hypothetical protein